MLYILVIVQRTTCKTLFPHGGPDHITRLGNDMPELSTHTLEPKPAAPATHASSTGSASPDQAHLVRPSASATSSAHPPAGFASWLSSNTTGYQGLDQKPLANLIAQYGSYSSTAWLDSERYKIWRPCQPIPESDFTQPKATFNRPPFPISLFSRSIRLRLGQPTCLITNCA